jgi:AraC-like DNA-binding protein
MALVKRCGVSSDDLLSGAGVDTETLANPRARLSVPTMVGLFERARSLTREPAIGLHIGLAIRPTLYGNLGFAFMSASNIRESIDLAIRFSPIVTTSLRFRLRVEGRAASIVVDELADFGSARDIVILAVLVSLRQIGAVLAERDLTTSAAEIALPEPSYAGNLAEANLPVRFDCPAHRLVFDARSLEVPYAMASPMALQLARAHCQQELDQFGAPTRWADSVRGLLARCDPRLRSLEDVAAALHQSTRTLKRRLAAEGVSFSALRADELREWATTLARSSLFTSAEIAERLGYSTVTNFDRAFRRWTSTTLVEFRRAASPSPASALDADMAILAKHRHSPAQARDGAPTTK